MNYFTRDSKIAKFVCSFTRKKGKKTSERKFYAGKLLYDINKTFPHSFVRNCSLDFSKRIIQCVRAVEVLESYKITSTESYVKMCDRFLLIAFDFSCTQTQLIDFDVFTARICTTYVLFYISSFLA